MVGIHPPQSISTHIRLGWMLIACKLHPHRCARCKLQRFGGGALGGILILSFLLRGPIVARASSPASSGGGSPRESIPASGASQRDAARTRSRDGCATKT